MADPQPDREPRRPRDGRFTDSDHTESRDAQGNLLWTGVYGLLLFEDDAVNLSRYGKTKQQIIDEHEAER